MEKSEKLWSRNFVLIIVINFLVFMNHIMLLSTFPFYIESLGGSEALAGLEPALQSMAVHSSSPAERGSANSTFLCAYDIGIGLGGAPFTQLPAIWVGTVLKNFLMALLWNLFAAGPLTRLIFRGVCRRNIQLKSAEDSI